MTRSSATRVSVVLWFAVMLSQSAIASASAGSTRTSVTHDCFHVSVRPHAILFACGDGGYYARRLHWADWHVRSARGAGVFYLNDCTPNCAEGTFHRARGTIVLSRPRYCRGIDGRVFSRMTVRYERPLLGDMRTRDRLYCPIDAG